VLICELPVEDFLFSAGGGFLFGAVAGEMMKIVAVVIGLFVVGLAYLSYRGWVDVKWAAMEDASRTTLTNASEQIAHALNIKATQFASHPSPVAASALPIAAMFGFVPGLMMGWQSPSFTKQEYVTLISPVTSADYERLKASIKEQGDLPLCCMTSSSMGITI
jgi:uncharacterized membrane protein (Fun14 family)